MPRPETLARRIAFDREPERDPARERDTALARRAASGCLEARNDLVRTHLPFVIRTARAYRGLGVPMEDLVHEGVLGLFEASTRFDPSRGCKFLTFSSWWVRKALRAALRQGPGVVSVPGYQRRRLREIEEAERDLHVRLGRPPEDEELSARLGRSVKRIRGTRRRLHREVRIDQPAGPAGGIPLADRLADPDEPGPELDVLRGELVDVLDDELSRLDERERAVLRWRFGLDGEESRSLQEISARIGISRERVRQIEMEARRRLRRRLARRRLAPVGA